MNPILYINWDIDPVIFSLGPVKIQYYGLIFAQLYTLLYQRFCIIAGLPSHA